MINETDFDIIVVGAGPAGFCAAIAAARMCNKVLLIEGSDSILGNITAGPLEAIMTFHDDNRQVVNGIAQEFVERCVDEGGVMGHVPDTVGYAKTITPFSPEICKYVGFKFLRDEGVHVLLQTNLLSCKTNNRYIESIQVISKTEKRIYKAKCFIDCTGDGDLAVLAGCDYDFGNNDGDAQPMTSLIQLGNVDILLLAKKVLSNPEDFRFFSAEALNEIKIAVDNGKIQALHLWGFYSLLNEGYRRGALSLKRQEMHLITGFGPGEVIINYTRVNGNPLDMACRSQAQVDLIIQGYELWKWLKKSEEAFQNSTILKFGRIGIRESRRIKGYHCITKKELEKGENFAHPVAMGAFPIDIHSAKGNSMEFYMINKGYRIPMESLVPKDIDNLMVAGRCISCTHEAQGSLRITATAMATGQAAGVCAALSAETGVICKDLDYNFLKEKLFSQNVILE